MIKIAVAVGALALVVAGCSAGDAGEADDTGSAPDAVSTEAAIAEPADSTDADAPDDGSSATVPANVCDLFDGIDPASLINTAAGAFAGSDDECSVPAADPLEFAQASITIGAAPALTVLRSNYEGPVYECEVVDLSDLGDAAFSCLGGAASSHVVFAAGEYSVIFSAGNNTAGPPEDSLFLAAAQQIHANMAG